MEARLIRQVFGVATVMLFAFGSPVAAQFGNQRQYAAHSQNFIALASSPQWATQVVTMAEQSRRDLAIHWLGAELPPWSERVPIHVQSSPSLGAGGETRFSLTSTGGVGNWMMSVQGTQERILDSVLPHEITHTIFATHFAPLGKYVPRWADEGACTTVEHVSEKRKHEHFLHDFLRTGRGLAFNKMFRLKDYPQDILPLYAQGHSAVQFLIDQGGPRKFVQFLEAGMRSDEWDQTLEEFYAYEGIGHFQTLWNRWLLDGSPDDLAAYAPGLQGDEALAPALAASDGGQPSPARPSQLQLASNATPADAPAISTIRPIQSSLPTDPPTLAANTAGMSAGGHTLGNESWYKRRLNEVSQADAPSARDLVEGNQPASSGYPLRPYQAQPGATPARQIPSGNNPLSAPSQASARPQPPQSPGVQVLDWGDSVPISGIGQQTSQAPQMVPIYR